MPNIGAITVAPQGVPDSDRITEAFGKRLNLLPPGTHATKAQIQQQVAQFIINVVQEQEGAVAASAAVAAIVPPGLNA